MPSVSESIQDRKQLCHDIANYVASKTNMTTATFSGGYHSICTPPDKHPTRRIVINLDGENVNA